MLEDFCIIIAIFLLVGLLLVIGLIFVFSGPKRAVVKRYRSECLSYTSSSKQASIELPSIFDAPSVTLSVVIPAYNETNRLGVMLNEAIEYLEKRSSAEPTFIYEIIVVDDGSSDSTSDLALTYTDKLGVEKFRVITLEHNRGKGGAVRIGVLSARGRLVLFADADGATQFSDLEKLEGALKERTESCIIVCGSRAHLEKESIATRSLFRTFLMIGFHFLVSFLCVRDIKDTQCGFKLFTRKAAQLSFPNLHVERWAFDVELLYIAQALRMTVLETAVKWHEVDGSKIVPFWSWLQMGKDLLLIRLRYLLGVWAMTVPTSQK